MPRPTRYGILVKKAQYNEFCKVWVKELDLDESSSGLHGINNIQTGTKAIMMKWPPIQEDLEFYLWIQITTLGFFYMLQYSPLFFLSPPYGGFYTLYRLFLIIWVLHLLIIQAHTWAPISSDTPFSLLWVVIAKVTLFRGLLHINTARKVAVVHLMWWWQLLLRYFGFSSFSCV